MFEIDQPDARAMSGSEVTAGSSGGQAPLSPDQWRQLESLLDVLLDTPPERRAVLFAEVSGGDPDRRAELERLVAECERAYPLLDRPAVDRFAALVHTPPLEASQVVAERYHIIRELGRGGMATVYLAHDLKHGRDVALKVVRSELAAALGSGRFLREIEIAARLRHPHIVPLYDSGRASVTAPATVGDRAADDIVYYVMPYEHGESLRERLRREGPLPVADAVSILRDVCDALGYAHAHGVVHRDIKPDNVLLSGGHALVTDFGVARAATEATESAATTGAGIMLGTPAYMAPEQVAADPRVDHRADIYAAGVLAYEMLAGSPPFGGDSPQEILVAQLTLLPESITTRRPDAPTALATLVMQCLEKKPADRWQTAREIVHALDDGRAGNAWTDRDPSGVQLAFEHESVEAPTVKLAPPSGRRGRRRWLTPAVAVTLSTVLAALALQTLISNRRSRASALPARLAIGIMPVTVASSDGDLHGLATGLPGQLSGELAPIPDLDVRPHATIAAWVAKDAPLDSLALASDVDYLVSMVLSKSVNDTILVALQLIEGGVRFVRVDNVRASRANATVDGLARLVAEQLRPMLGSRVRERELESRSTNMLAIHLRRRAEHQRLSARQRMSERSFQGAERAVDSAAALLIESERLDPAWTAPRLARATLSGLSARMLLEKSRGADLTGIGRLLDAGIALVDSVLLGTPRDPMALAARGRLRWQRALLTEPNLHNRKPAADSARRDLEEALSIEPGIARAAADLGEIFHTYARYEEAIGYAQQAYAADAYLEEASQIIYRLALGHLEIGNDVDAGRWCAVGARRFPENPAHYGCMIEVMAWGTGPTNPDSAWMTYRQLERLTTSPNVTARAAYGTYLAAALAKARGVSPDSARAVLARVHEEVSASAATSRTTRDMLLAYEAAVLYRLGDSRRADELLSEFRRRDPERASLWANRRMLRGYVSSPAPGSG